MIFLTTALLIIYLSVIDFIIGFARSILRSIAMFKQPYSQYQFSGTAKSEQRFKLRLHSLFEPHKYIFESLNQRH